MLCSGEPRWSSSSPAASGATGAEAHEDVAEADPKEVDTKEADERAPMLATEVTSALVADCEAAQASAGELVDCTSVVDAFDSESRSGCSSCCWPTRSR